MMPLFFFDFQDHGEPETRDDEGCDLASPEAARDAALLVLPSIARDRPADDDRRIFAVAVRDGGGRALLRATLTLEAEWLDGASEAHP